MSGPAHLNPTPPPRGQRPSPFSSHHDHPPSSTLLLRGLAPSVDDEMIVQALQPFRPLQARTIYNKTTGESRGFAFVDFNSVESAIEAMRAFEAKPLVLHHREVTMSYTDRFRHDADSNRSKSLNGGTRDNNETQRQGERWQPRPDWICNECNVTNFARRTHCFQCNVPKAAQTRVVTASNLWSHTSLYQEREEGEQSGVKAVAGALPRDGELSCRRRESNRSVPPSQVLVVRLLPPDIEEGELHVAFAEIDGVQDIRLIRDRVTNLSRGFAFIEFRDIETATVALKQCQGLIVHNTPVEVSYARDSLSTRSHNSTEGFPSFRSGASLVVTALEQAQWLLFQGRSADVTTQNTDQQNHVAADVNALLDDAAAQVVPQFEQPKKLWPLPFETAGGSYVFVSDYGLYWDQDSMFYYDAPSKLYHNSFTGSYFHCIDPTSTGATAFQTFLPPLPVDDEVYEDSTAFKVTTSSKPALSLSLKKEKKKGGLGLALGVKSSAFASPTSLGKQRTTVLGTNTAAGPATTVTAAGIGIKRKSAADIAKWSQRKREATMENGDDPSPLRRVAVLEPPTRGEGVNSNESALPLASQKAPDPIIAALTTVPQEAPICLLCRRKFGSLEMLRKHETLSKLHLANLAKAQENKQHVAAQYREHEREMEREAKQQRQKDMVESKQKILPEATNPEVEPTTSSIEAGIGGKLLKMMGWKRGEGLGKHGTGITVPIKAASGRDDLAGIGCKASLTASVDLSDAKSDKERRQKLARARYDAENNA